MFRDLIFRRALLTALLAATGCTNGSDTTTGGSTSSSSGSALSCGPGTELRDGKCVSTSVPAPCADGSTRDPVTGQCVSRVQCSPGTTYNASTGECELDATCGLGTHYNPATRACDPDVTCGPSTAYDTMTRTCVPLVTCGPNTTPDATNGTCVPEEQCGTGTFLDPDSFLCVPDLACGPRLIPLDGVCRTPADVVASRADAIEPGNEMNDPEFGGMPAVLTLEAIGEETIFAGTIGRPVDFDDDMVLDQDRDLWQFEGTAGQYLRIRVLDNGLPQPGFILDGPNNFSRRPVLGRSLEADRKVILPYTGTYTLTILPTAVILDDGTGSPLGASTAGYVGIIDQLAWPMLRPLAPGMPPDGATLTGDLLDLDDNFFVATASAGSALSAAVNTVGVTTTPKVLSFLADKRFLQEMVMTRATDGSGYSGIDGLYGAAADSVVVVLDWSDSNGEDNTFAVTFTALGKDSVGDVPVDGSVEAPRSTVIGRLGRAVTFNATEGQVIYTHLDGLSSAPVTLVGPSGTVIERINATGEAHTFYTVETGTYVYVILNTSTSDSFLDLGIFSRTPIDGGTYDGSMQVRATFTGPDLSTSRRLGDRAFVLVENTAPVHFVFGYASAPGMQTLEIQQVTETGTLRDRRSQTETDYAGIATSPEEPGFTLVTLRPRVTDRTPDPPVRNWAITVEANPVPTATETEPNDTQADATAIDSLPAMVRGAADDDEVDYFAFELTPLMPGELVQVQVQNLNGSTATSLYVERDNAGIPLIIDEALTTDLGNSFIFPADGAGTYFIRLVGQNTTAITDYVLDVRRISATSETEPNQTAMAATSLGTLGAGGLTAYGVTTSADPDVFQVAAASALPARSGVMVRMENVTDSDVIALSIQDGAGNTVDNTERHDAVLQFIPDGTTPFFITVTGKSATRKDQYRLTVETVPVVDVEPNNTIAQANALPALGPGETTSVQGIEGRLGLDYFRIDLDGALGVDEHLTIQHTNLNDRGNTVVRIINAAGIPLDENRIYASELFIYAPGALGPYYVEVMPESASASAVRRDLYRLDVTRGPGRAELEPNNRAPQANALPALPATIRGVSRVDDPDFYALTLPRAVASNEVVEFKVRTDTWYADALVNVYGSMGGMPSGFTARDPALRVRPSTGMGSTLYFEVSIPGAATARERVAYTVTASIVPGEPNVMDPTTGGGSSSSSGGSSSSSGAPMCGNGAREMGELCDDGNLASGDGCSDMCAVEAGHFFDTEPNDTPATALTAAFNNGEAVVHGNLDPIADVDVISFTINAVSAVRIETFDGSLPRGTCTTGITHNLELVDPDGVTVRAFDDASGTGMRCAIIEPGIHPQVTRLPAGTYFVRVSEDGHNMTASYQVQINILSTCGNMMTEPPEGCDDGNMMNGDGCENDCTFVPVCGDDRIEGSEICDDGNTMSGDGCSDLCVHEAQYCSDGTVNTSGEECDDNNLRDGDGCDHACRAEPGFFYEREMNGTAATGNVIPVPVVIRGAITPLADQDYFTFTLDAPSDVTIELFDASLTMDTCAVIDPEIFLFAADGTTQLATDDLDGLASCSLLTPSRDPVMRQMQPGTYHLLVTEDGDNLEIAGYQARITLDAVCGDNTRAGYEECDDGNLMPGDGCDAICRHEPDCGDGTVAFSEECDDGNTDPGDGCSAMCTREVTPETEPNNTAANADAAPFRFTVTHRVSGAISPATDLDYFRIDLAAASTVHFETFDGTGVSCTTITTLIKLFGSDGTTQLFTDTSSGVSSCSALTVQLAAGTYYVQVEESGRNAVIAAYQLEVAITATATSETEPNSLQSQALPLSSDEYVVARGNRGAADEDWYAVTLDTSASLRIELFEGGAQQCVVTSGIASRIALYDAQGTQIDSDTTTGRGDCSLLDGTGPTGGATALRNLAPGTYFIRVDSANTTPRGEFDYRLLVITR